MADTLNEAFEQYDAETNSNLVVPVNDILMIDPETRVISVPDSEKLLGVKFDVDVERKHFKCPKIVGDNIDLSQHIIYVVYQKSNEAGTVFSDTPGMYYCEDMAVEGDYITFSWKLSGNVLSDSGFIAFKVVAAYTEGEELKTRWNTVPAIGIVKMTLNNVGEQIEEQYPDIITQLLQRMDEVEQMTEGEYQQAVNNFLASYLEEHPLLLDETLSDNTKAAPAGMVGEIYNDIDKFRNGYISPSIDVNTVRSMFDIASTYCEQAYTEDGEDANLIYESGKGLYTDDLGTNAENGQYSIVCNEFVGAIINAIPWNFSRYYGRETNARLPWGYVYDNTAIIRRINNSEPTEIEQRERYVNSNLMAKYAYEHGFWYENNGIFQPCAGDVFFSGDADDTINWRGIDHCGMVLSADSLHDGSGRLQCIEAFPTTKTDSDGTKRDCAIRFNNYEYSSIDSFARFPISGANGKPSVLIYENEEPIVGTVEDNGRVLYDASSNILSSLTKGFYTILIDANDITGENIYIQLNYRCVSYTTSTIRRFSKCGNYYYLVTYIEHTIGTLFQILMPTTTVSYDIKSLKIFKGFVSPYGY